MRRGAASIMADGQRALREFRKQAGSPMSTNGRSCPSLDAFLDVIRRFSMLRVNRRHPTRSSEHTSQSERLRQRIVPTYICRSGETRSDRYRLRLPLDTLSRSLSRADEYTEAVDGFSTPDTRFRTRDSRDGEKDAETRSDRNSAAHGATL